MTERKENLTREVEFKYQGDIELLMNLHRKMQMIETEDHRQNQIRTGIIFMGGGQLGALHAGTVHGILDYGLGETFDYAIGSSAGAVAAVHLATQEPYKGGSIIWEDNAQSKAINLKKPYKIMDSTKFERTLRETKRANYSLLHSSRTKVLIGLTEYISGEPLFINPTEVDDPADYVLASACNTVFNGNNPYIIDGYPYSDGTLSSPLPITYALNQLKLNNILVVMTCRPVPKNTGANISNYVFNAFYNLREGNQRFNEEIRYLTGQRSLPAGVNVASVYPSKLNIHNATNDRIKLMNAALEARWFMHDLLKPFQK